MADSEENEVTAFLVCMRCHADLPYDHEGNCTHCGKDPSAMGWELFDDPKAAKDELLEQVKFIRNTPPTCLANFTTSRKKVSRKRYDATVQWEIGCKCGAQTGTVHGYHEEDSEHFGSPLSFQCGSCHSEHVFFDQSLHGYNRAFDSDDDQDENPREPDGDKITAQCPNCSSAALTVRLTFSNPSGSGVDLEDEPEYTDRCQDFFDNFACQCLCSKCSKSWTLTEFECA